MSLDLTKPVQTRDGRKVRILCTDAKRNAETIVGLIGYEDGSEIIGTWTADGLYNYTRGEGDSDIINVSPLKKKVKVELRLYRSDRMTTGLAARLGVVAILDGETFGPAPHIASTTIEMEYEVQP